MNPEIRKNSSRLRTLPGFNIQSSQLDEATLKKYKSSIIKRVAGSFLLVFLIVLERVFSDYTKSFENDLIDDIQVLFGIQEYGDDISVLGWLTILHSYQYFNIVLLHVYLSLYYLKHPIVTLKVLIVHFNFLIAVASCDILFAEPRPFWINSGIVGIVCEASYSFPSFSVFSLTFILIYGVYCFERAERNEDHDQQDLTSSQNTARPPPEGKYYKIFKWGFSILIILIYCFFAMVSGLNYLSQILLGGFYSLLSFLIATFLEKSLNNLTLNSSTNIEKAKVYSIGWLIYVFLVASISSLIYNAAGTFLDIKWMQNFFLCLKSQKDTSYNIKAFYHLLGPWPTFLKTSIIFCVIGIILGTARTFRVYEGKAWFETTRRNKILMAVIANIFVIPMWVLTIYQGSVTSYFAKSGLNNYFYYAILFFGSYFFLFGLLPTSLFRKMNLVNLQAGPVEHESEKPPYTGSLLSPSVINTDNFDIN